MTQTAPRSSTDIRINILGVMAFAVAIYACNICALSGLNAVLTCLLAYAGTILLLEVIYLRTPWRDSVGLDFSRPKLTPKRVVIKLIGIYGSFGFIGFLYWLFPEYHGTFYNNYWNAIRNILPIVLVLAVPYAAFMDCYQKEPNDTYHRFGKFLLLDWDGLNFRQIGQHALGWLVKGFFLPLMFTSVHDNINSWVVKDLRSLPQNFEEFFHITLLLFYTLDLMVAVTGYVLTIRLLDTHVRSTEPTMFGWWVCTLCYQPFQGTFLRLYLQNIGNEDNWMIWLHDYPIFQALWGMAAMATIAVYMSSRTACIDLQNIPHMWERICIGGSCLFHSFPGAISPKLCDIAF